MRRIGERLHGALAQFGPVLGGVGTGEIGRAQGRIDDGQLIGNHVAQRVGVRHLAHESFDVDVEVVRVAHQVLDGRPLRRRGSDAAEVRPDRLLVR